MHREKGGRGGKIHRKIGTKNGRRRIGRLRLRWLDCIKQDTKKAEMEDENWRTVTQDRRLLRNHDCLPQGYGWDYVAMLTLESGTHEEERERERPDKGEEQLSVSSKRHRWQTGVNKIGHVSRQQQAFDLMAKSPDALPTEIMPQ